MTGAVLEGVRDLSLGRPDGRVVAWSESGDEAGLPLLRVPGTPGCRYSLRAGRAPWAQRQLRVITAERPGFGASTRLPGRGLCEPADDLAAVLDHLGLGAVHVMGGSGSAPHQLALAARHRDRVRAMTVLVGAAPCAGDEAGQMIGINAGARVGAGGRCAGATPAAGSHRAAMPGDPIAVFRAVMDRAPAAGRAVMADPRWHAGLVAASKEALGQGVGGRADEAFALGSRWDDVDLAALQTPVTWWHAPKDANAPLPAARRVVGQLPHARLITFSGNDGHLAGYHRQGEILDELLARG